MTRSPPVSTARTTGSGTTILRDVYVPADAVVPHQKGFERPGTIGSVGQIIHAGIDLGIARAALKETIGYVRDKARPWMDSGVGRAADDPLTIVRIGELAIRIEAAEAVLAAPRVTDAAADLQPAAQGASLAASRAQLGDALGSYEESATHAVLDRLFAGFTIETAISKVIVPYLADLGERWATGTATIAQEHFATSLIRGRLLGLARGSGIRSLSGMAPVSGPPAGTPADDPRAARRYRRPFLTIDRQSTRRACLAQSLPVWDDPHNTDRAYTRSRVRHEALPVLEKALG